MGRWWPSINFSLRKNGNCSGWINQRVALSITDFATEIPLTSGSLFGITRLFLAYLSLAHWAHKNRFRAKFAGERDPSFITRHSIGPFGDLCDCRCLLLLMMRIGNTLTTLMGKEFEWYVIMDCCLRVYNSQPCALSSLHRDTMAALGRGIAKAGSYKGSTGS